MRLNRSSQAKTIPTSCWIGPVARLARETTRKRRGRVSRWQTGGPRISGRRTVENVQCKLARRWERIASLVSKIRYLRRYLRCFASVLSGLNLLTKHIHTPDTEYSWWKLFKRAGQRPCFTIINSVTIFWTSHHILVQLPTGRDSSVGVATRYGLDGAGIETRWGPDFPHPSRPALGPTQPSVWWEPGNYLGQSGRGVLLTTHLHLGLKLKKE